jgi:dienelactone hydrolase
MRNLIASVLFLSFVVWHSPLHAATSIEEISIATASRSTSDLDVYVGRVFPTDTIRGTLLIPDGVKAPMPLMIVMHGSGGRSKRDLVWADDFVQQGIAALVLDTFTSRGVSATTNDQGQITYAASTLDVLYALKAISSDKRFDASRVGVIGFSRGGVAALYSADDKFRSAVGSHKFAVHYALYPGCRVLIHRFDGSPLRIYQGDSDSYDSPTPCKELIDSAKAHQIDAAQVVFEGVRHGFDNDANTGGHVYPNGVTWKRCDYRWDTATASAKDIPSGRTIPGKDFAAYKSGCTDHGIAVEFNEQAYKETRNAVLSDSVQQLRVR